VPEQATCGLPSRSGHQLWASRAQGSKTFLMSTGGGKIQMFTVELPTEVSPRPLETALATMGACILSGGGDLCCAVPKVSAWGQLGASTATSEPHLKQALAPPSILRARSCLSSPPVNAAQACTVRGEGQQGSGADLPGGASKSITAAGKGVAAWMGRGTEALGVDLPQLRADVRLHLLPATGQVTSPQARGTGTAEAGSGCGPAIRCDLL
ncbi:hypothetical protein P7K49_040141, partial [Saguinus oedipus]